MQEEPFEVEVDGGVLPGHRRGEGPPALLLHGGPGFPDYTAGLAEELAPLLTIHRYTQRGAPPATAGPPYSVESHVADAIAVLDALGLARAWAIGHSWGGYLALHLLLTHPERLLGVVCICALGAYDPFEQMGATLRASLSPEQLARVDEISERRSRGEASPEEAAAGFDILWPHYFADPATAPPNSIAHIGVECSLATFQSITRHAELGTLERGLPETTLPVLVVHGELDPLPIETARATAALIPSAVFTELEGHGHFPWLEQPGVTRDAVERFLG